MGDVLPGLYQVELDLSSLATTVNVAQVEEGLYDEDMMRLLTHALDDDSCLLLPPPSSPPVMYHLYIVTPPDKAAEYVLRLPYFLSDTCILSLADCFLACMPAWYTFANTQSIMYISFTTSSSPATVEAGLRDLASWVDLCTSYSTTYSHLFAPTFSPNIASILCTTQSVLLIDHDREEPTWLPHVDGGVTLFSHTVQVTPPPPLSTTPDWVRHMSTHLDMYTMHTRFSRVERYHVEPRRPTPVSWSPAPCASLPTPPPQSPSSLPTLVELHPGDWVVYLTPATDAFVLAQVRTVSPAFTLDTEFTPTLLAKFDPEHHCLSSDLQPVESFMLTT